FNSQGSSMTLSAYVFGQSVTNLAVKFTIKAAGQSPVTICQSVVSDVDTYSCNWDFTLNGALFHNGPVTLGFMIAGNRQSGGAFAPAVNPDGVRAGRITYEQTQASTNYAGYAATNLSGTTDYQKVTGSWTVPSVSCSPGELSASAFWVGMTSRDETSKSLLAQLGTDSDCQNGTPIYYLWWEMFPAPSMTLQLPLQPGDVATASVIFQQGTFQLTIDVPNEGDHFSINQPGSISSTSLAECIVEAPFLIDNPATGQGHIIQLTNFGQISLTCQINNNEPVANGPQDYVYQMQTDFGTNKATTSGLDQSGTTFTVVWNHG
ncbi:MAG TPA: G1 family glutamic endopeptidase, partial [Chthonomonadales bacterium]|nr:G1 family glutamic endopeptidase [Chthonomonadales bacterium]